MYKHKGKIHKDYKHIGEKVVNVIKRQWIYNVLAFLFLNERELSIYNKKKFTKMAGYLKPEDNYNPWSKKVYYESEKKIACYSTGVINIKCQR